jgi:hypothetical protein
MGWVIAVMLVPIVFALLAAVAVVKVAFALAQIAMLPLRLLVRR